jgi:hypothetical protein
MGRKRHGNETEALHDLLERLGRPPAHTRCVRRGHNVSAGQFLSLSANVASSLSRRVEPVAQPAQRVGS